MLDQYPITRIDDLIDLLSKANYLTKIDLSKGFLQIPVKRENQSKAAFQTPYGKFEFLRMPFGLVNAPSTFQRSMNLVLQGLEDETSCYIDDIVMFSEERDEHLGQIRNVLQRTANPPKCM